MNDEIKDKISEQSPYNFKPTEDEKNRIISVLGDDVIYKCVSGLACALMLEGGKDVVKVTRSKASREDKLESIIRAEERTATIDKLLYYVELWRRSALNKRTKEEKNAGIKKK